MANVELHFFAANDLNGDPIWTLTDDEEYFLGFEMRVALNERGGATFTLSRAVGFALFSSGFVSPEVFVRVLIPAVSTTRYQFGFFLDNRNEKIVSGEEQAGEIFTFGGPGPRFYLTRAQLWDEQFSGAGYLIDLANRVFRWKESATAGKVAARLIAEDQQNTLAEFIPQLSKGFSDTLDSAGVAWADPIAEDDEFELPIGVDYEKLVTEIEKAGDLESTFDLGTVATPRIRWDLWQSYGVDRSAGSFAADKVLFKEGVNILTDLEHTGQSLRKASHALVFGMDESTGRAVRTSWDEGEYAKAIAYDYPRSRNEAILERAGLRMLRRQANEELEVEFEMAPGFDPANGFYFPGDPDTTDGHFKVGDYCALTTGPDVSWSALDYRAELERILAYRLVLDEAADDTDEESQALSWHVVVELNIDRDSASSPATGAGTGTDGNNGGGGGCNCPKLCHPTVGAVEDELLYEWLGDDDGGDTLQWTGVLGNQGSAFAGVHCYFKSSSPTEWAHVVACPSEGTLRITGAYTQDSLPAGLKLGFFDTGLGASGNNVNKISEHTLASGAPWPAWDAIDEDIAIPAGTVGIALGRIPNSASFDEMRVYAKGTTGSDLNAGDGGRAARCDHKHHVMSVDEPTVDDDSTLGYEAGTVWLQVDDVAAPTEILGLWYLLDATAGAAVWGEPPGGGGGGGGGHTIEDNGTPLTARTGLNFLPPLKATDDSGGDETDISVDMAESGDISTQAFGDSPAAGANVEYAGGAHKHGMPANPVTGGAVMAAIDFGESGDISAEAFGDTAAAGGTGEVADAGHRHAMPANPVTAHETAEHTDNDRTRTLYGWLDSGADVIAVDSQCIIPVEFTGAIVGVRIMSPQTGSIEVDFWLDDGAAYPPTDADSITGGNELTVSSDNYGEDTTLTSWTTAVTAGDVLIARVDSVTTWRSCVIAIKVLV